MSTDRPDAHVHFDPNTGRLNVTLSGDPCRPEMDRVKTLIVRFEYESGSNGEQIIRVPQEDTDG